MQISLVHCGETRPKYQFAVSLQKSDEAGAAEFLQVHQNLSAQCFVQIMEEDGLHIQQIDQDYVSGHTRYFADILPITEKVCVYLKSIALWAKEQGCSCDLAMNLILMHAYFHYWEYKQPVPAARLYTVPMLQAGPFKIGKTGIAALSEIAANAFVWGLWDADFLRIRTQWQMETEQETS